MTSPLLWTLVALQLAMGLFDIVYHHELTERLAWRPTQRVELMRLQCPHIVHGALPNPSPVRRAPPRPGSAPARHPRGSLPR